MIFNQQQLEGSAQLQLENNKPLQLPQSADGELFSDMVNFRPEKRNFRNVLKMREGISGGIISFGQEVVRQYSFSSSLPDGVRRFIVFQHTNGQVTLYDQTNDATIPVTLPTSLGSDPADFTPVGRFLYIFSDPVNCYVNLGLLDEGQSSLQAYKYLAVNAKKPASGNSVTKSKNTDDQSAFDLRVGSKVIAFPTLDAVDFSDSLGQKNTPGTYTYQVIPTTYTEDDGSGEPTTSATGIDFEARGFQLKGGRYYYVKRTLLSTGVMINGKHYVPENIGDYLALPFFYTDQVAWILGPGFLVDSGFDPEVYPVDFKANGSVGVFDTTVTRVYNDSGSYKFYIKDREENEHEIALSGKGFRVAPLTPELEQLLGGGGSVFADEDGNVTADSSYINPTLHRGYKIVEVLDDGSLSLPGPAHTESVSINDLVTADGQLVSVSVNLPAPTNDNVVSRYVFATRWMPNKDDIFKPSTERHPNGAFFFHSTIDVEGAHELVDNKPDSQLTVPMASDVSMTAGIVNWIAPSGDDSGIKRCASTSFRQSLLLGGYKVARPKPVENTNVFFESSGSGSGSSTVKIYFKYTDGRYSPALTKSITNGKSYEVFFGSLNVMVDSVEVFISDRRVSTISQGDLEFSGKPLALSSSMYADGESGVTPSASKIRVDLALDAYIVAMAPPQNASVTQQNKVMGNSRVSRIYVIDMNNALESTRYYTVAITDDNIQSGILDYDDTSLRADFKIEVEGDDFGGSKNIRRIGDIVLATTKKGMIALSAQDVQTILPRDIVYTPESLINLIDQANGIAYSDKWEEYYISTGTEYVIVLRPELGWRLYKYSNAINFVTDIGGNIYAVEDVSNGRLVRVDDPNSTETLTADLITRPIGGFDNEVRLIEASIFGYGFDAQVSIDSQPYRRVDSNDSWTEFFTPTYNSQSQFCNEKGVYYALQGQAKRPRLRFRFTNANAPVSGGFLQSLFAKYRILNSNSMRR